MAGLVYGLLRALESYSPASPGDLARRVDIPRYKVLSLMQALEELGLVEAVYSRGSYKIYVLSELGRSLLLSMERGVELRSVIELGLASSVGGAVDGVSEGEPHTISSGT
ncbi:MAG: helix-turn-helix domain-containing protein [Aeropyrum sp.]|nr:helix-turn-helix domain-containing protein [Aeropyrum sp.]MCE4615669.1 helix-turn-helix domain-containing protein [Aeropyrum sp.]